MDRRPVRLLTTVLAAAAVAYSAILIIVFMQQDALLYPGATGGPAPPAAWGTPVRIDTPDGETLFALHTDAAEGRPTVLFFHGNADRVDRYGFLSRALAEREIGLLAVSYRGYPGSTGAPSETGLLTDGRAAYDWLASRSSGPIFVLGQSLGSGVGVYVAAERPAAGLVLLSAYDSIASVASARFWFLPVSLLIHDPFRSIDWIGRVPQPKLFVHGGRDTLIPLSHGQALFAAAAQPKRKILFNDAGHNDLWRPALIADLIGFLEEIAPPRPS